MMTNEEMVTARLDNLAQYSTKMISHAIWQLCRSIRPLVFLYSEVSGSDILFDKGFLHSLDVLEKTFKPKFDNSSNGRYMNK